MRLRLHTQDLEGANDFIKLVCQRCPWLNLQTLSDRLRLRRKVIDGSPIHKWSLLKDKVEHTKRTCLEFLGKADEMLDDLLRFHTPAPISAATHWPRDPMDHTKKWRSLSCLLATANMW